MSTLMKIWERSCPPFQKYSRGIVKGVKNTGEELSGVSKIGRVIMSGDKNLWK